MKLNELAVSLFEAIQDGKHCAVEVQPIREVGKDYEQYFIRIDGKRQKVSEKFATNAIQWNVPVVYLDKIYKLANIRFRI